MELLEGVKILSYLMESLKRVTGGSQFGESMEIVTFIL